MTAKRKAGPRPAAPVDASGAAPATAAKPPRRNRQNLSDLAYDRLEELIVTCALKPGLFLSIQDLQEPTGVGRTPIHQAISRLAADTLVVVRPRHGLQIAPVDLARERTLLQLRRDLERFVVRLATERAGPSHRNQILHLGRTLRARAAGMAIGEFNQLDRRIDQVLGAAAGEPFLEHTMRPLHTIFRRVGWIYHNWIAPDRGVGRTVECHLAILDAVADRRVEDAVAASDGLIEFSGSMFAEMERGIDPALLDCNLELLAAS